MPPRRWPQLAEPEVYFRASRVVSGPSDAVWTRICFSSLDCRSSTFIAIKGQRISRRK